jgi:DtxR family manganese transport transcriptional regulator
MVPRKASTEKGRRPSTAPSRAVNPFRRTRRDHTRETAEDYAELVADLIAEKGEARITDMAQRLGISSVTVSRTVARLQKGGVLRSEPYRAVFLTEEGERLARLAHDRHQIVAAFLETIGVPADVAAADAEGMEHHASRTTLARMHDFVVEHRRGEVVALPSPALEAEGAAPPPRQAPSEAKSGANRPARRRRGGGA